MPNVIDLFAGPGGLAEGFSSLLVNGARQFNIKLSVEKDPIPYQTLKLRAFFRSFTPGQAPIEYYDFIAGRITIDDLYRAHPDNLEQAEEDALQATLGECSHDWLDGRITRAINGDHNWILIGGPPCQAYSIAGTVGNRTKKDYCQTTDPRFFLYREYLRVVAVHAPSVFVMENVKGLLTAKNNGTSIAENIMRGLSNPAEFMQQEYGIHIDTPRYRLFALTGEELPEDGNRKIFIVPCEK